jgi:hypothetical protein
LLAVARGKLSRFIKLGSDLRESMVGTAGADDDCGESSNQKGSGSRGVLMVVVL